MTKNSIDVYGAEGKGNLLTWNPENLHLVTDEASPLYDKRVHLPLQESFIDNIMAVGVIEPVVVKKNPETGLVEVVVGRQRVKAAREANVRLKAAGKQTMLVPGYATRLSDPIDLAGMVVSENENREADSPVGRAEKMARLMTYGADEARVARYFGCATSTVRNSLKLLDCSKVVREAVDSGKIGLGHAMALAPLPPADQRERVKELVAAGEATTGHERARKQRAIAKPEAARMKTKKEITAERDRCSGERLKALDWVLGN